MITDLIRILLTRSFKPLKLTDKASADKDSGELGFGIYVHIPFCITLCPFCPYNKIKYDKKIVKPYCQALISEINMAGRLNGLNKNVNSVYFGGGTPALIADELPEIIAALRNNFNIKSNIGIELHPRDINEESLRKIKDAGFDMVSIGIQSFDQGTLDSLGREYIDGKEKVILARDAGFSVIDVDLIFGIKNQTEESLKSDFITAYKSGATQVSTYPFIDFSYAKNINKPSGKNKKRKFLNCIEDTAGEIDWKRTAVWTFGKKGSSRYSSITRDVFMGFGASSVSLTKNKFKINTFSVPEYIKRVNEGKIPTALSMELNLRNRALYWLFWNAYTLKFDNSEFKKLFGKNLKDVFRIELFMAAILGIIKKEDDNYYLTKRGIYFYHLAEQKFTNQYIDKTWRTASNNPWPEEIKLY
ncbi:MAG: radical SAM protein [Bacillota bacterium]|nr:radical SAM protein [Bacillota bacterium]